MEVLTRCHLLEFLSHEGRYIVTIVDAVRDEFFLDREQQVFLKHTLDDILRRAEDVVVLVSHLDLGECSLVDVEGLVNEFHFLTGLFVVPFLKILFDVFVDVVRPVEHFELVCAVHTTGCQY